MNTKNQKTFSFVALALLAVVGTYNALVMNADSELSEKDAKIIRRLDETYGIVKQGRTIATESKWTKLRGPAVAVAFKSKNKKSDSFEANNEINAAVNESLALNVTEVTDGKGQVVTTSGQLVTNNGTIESLEVKLPNGEPLSVAYSEMTGNVFEYEMNGEVLSGMMYQVDESSYMVTFSNGTLEGYRMRFSAPQTEEMKESQSQILAENHQVKIGSFGI